MILKVSVRKIVIYNELRTSMIMEQQWKLKNSKQCHNDSL